jgi:hypothetical protein
MFRGGELEPIIEDGVFREGVESVIRPLDIVKEDSTILMLHDRLELLFGRLLLDTFDGKILFAREVALVLPFADSIDVVAFASAPTLLPGRMTILVPPAAPAPALVPVANSAMLRTTETMELLQSVGRNTGVKHGVIPDVLRPLRGLQSRRIDEGRSAGPLVCDLPGLGDRRVATWWWAVEGRHR